MSEPFFTIGHSTRTIEEFVALLQAGRVGMVVDIRTVPRSRTNPRYNEDALPDALAAYQIGHRRIAALGGLRKRVPQVPPETNGWWSNRSFHNYADHALSAEFGEGLEELIGLGRARRVAMMCSEAVWWRCHRRIVADWLIARGETVCHLMGDDKVDPARLCEGARTAGGAVTYPAA
ncbi:MAG: hypothetical protein QOC65_1640 [Sphingomonadales bacterium]|nr:hypothetical protein [Sphingomonadales bacterium]